MNAYESGYRQQRLTGDPPSQRGRVVGAPIDRPTPSLRVLFDVPVETTCSPHIAWVVRQGYATIGALQMHAVVTQEDSVTVRLVAIADIVH